VLLIADANIYPIDRNGIRILTVY